MHNNDDFPRIGHLALISNSQDTAIMNGGTVEFQGGPTPNSPLFFAALLGRTAGSFGIRPRGADQPTAVGYLLGTLVYEVVWETKDYRVVATFAMVRSAQRPRLPMPLIVTTIRCERGSVEVEVFCQPIPGSGSEHVPWQQAPRDPDVWTMVSKQSRLQLAFHTDLATDTKGSLATASTVLNAGEEAYAALAWHGNRSAVDILPRSLKAAKARVAATTSWWEAWTRRGRFPGDERGTVQQRAAVVLRGLFYERNGAFLAAATTSLPAPVGGWRNWDYRFCWPRDGALAAKALLACGYHREARAFLDFIARRVKRDGGLRVLYPITDGGDIEERTLGHLPGYMDSRPVREGNGALGQLQLDIAGWVLDLLRDHVRAGGGLHEDHRRLIQLLVDQVLATWRLPDAGLWEKRGPALRHIASLVMCWVALDAAAWLMERDGQPATAAAWRAEAGLIVEDVREHGFDENGCLMEALGSSHYDVSALLAIIYGFPLTSAQREATANGVFEHLSTKGLLHRYDLTATPDGIAGGEATFVLATTWQIMAFAMIGKVELAQKLLTNLLRYAGPTGLFAEQIDAKTGEQMGNFPQAFSHIGLLFAAQEIAAARKRRGSGQAIAA